jgi:hypothetical protein
MHEAIEIYNNHQNPEGVLITNLLATLIDTHLPEATSKIWHAHPVWFLNDNPIVGYSLQKKGWRLMFWSGASFEEPALIGSDGKFKDASIFYNNISEINIADLKKCLEKSSTIQWDYKNIVKRKGVLLRL